MKRVFAIIAGVFLLTLGMGLAASADNGPHGNYSAMTDKCAACHRAHTARSEPLLTSEATDTDRSGFCYSCHSGGAGAYTDVRNGLFLSDTIGPVNHELTTFPSPLADRSLLGGGFEQTKMNTDLNSTGPQVSTATSSHMFTGGSNIVWGYGPISTTASVGVANVSLTCTNCHNPHGGAGANNTPTYRLLKGNNTNNSPLFSNGTTTVMSFEEIPDEFDGGAGEKYYFTELVQHGSPGNYYASHPWPTEDNKSIYALMTKWCSQCHTRYQAPRGLGSGHTDSGDAVFKYRHATNLDYSSGCVSCHTEYISMPPTTPGCMTCHVAHGTGARTGNWAKDVNWPDGTTTPIDHERSALLRLDGRLICMQCHPR